MRGRHVLIALLVAGLVAGMAPAAPAGDKGAREEQKRRVTVVRAVRVVRRGEAICFDRGIRYAGVVVAGNRCYTTYLIRTRQGAFLAFGPPGPPMIPPGQLVRLNTPAGRKHRGRLFYLVPVPVRVVAIPVDTIRFVRVDAVPRSDRVVIVFPPVTVGGMQERPFELPFGQ